jgi:PAS domain S-box-containing protein
MVSMVITERAPTPHERQTAILERIATNAPLQGTLDALVAHVEAQIPGAIGSLHLLDPDGRHLRCASAHGLPLAFRIASDRVAIGPCEGSCGTAAHRREPVFATDIAADPLWRGRRELAASQGLRACWSTPILSRRRPDRTVPLGTLAVYFHDPAVPEPGHREVLAHAEYLACIALDADYAIRELRESDARLRMFVDHATDGFFVHDGVTDAVVEANQQACVSLGYTRDELIGATTSLFDPHVSCEMLHEISCRLAGGEIVTLDSRHVRKDGGSFPVEVRIRAFEPAARCSTSRWSATPPRARSWRTSSAMPRRWRRSAGSPAASPTTSTTCSP